MAALTAISGAGAKGPACFLLEAEGRRLLLDLGYGPQPGLWPDVSGVGKVDALLLSHAGAAARLIEQYQGAVAPDIVFTGYLPPGTPAARLTQSGRASYLRWNVHPRLSDNVALVRATGAHIVVPAFGERRHLAAWSQAFAPARVTVSSPVAL